MKSFRMGIIDAIHSALHKLAISGNVLTAWESEECLTRLQDGDTVVKVFAFVCEANHRSYLIEVANGNGVSALLFSEELEETINALSDARQAITERERTFLED